MLTSVDLFSGIGGFALALRGVAEPAAFCDRDERVVAKLGALMARGELPRAPIVRDVRDLTAIKAAVRGRKVDLVTAGFPCVGFSVSGAHEGLRNEQSGLFHAASDVVAALRPRLVFFENVVGIRSPSHAGDLALVASRMRELGYTLRWTVVSAADVGAAQLRRRWYCLATRDGAPHGALRLGRTAPFPRRPRVPLVTADPANRAAFPDRIRALGNAIVPLAARLAFVRLYSGFRVVDASMIGASVAYAPCPAGSPSDGPPRHGCVGRGGRYAAVAVPDWPRRSTRISVDPNHYAPPPGYVRRPSATPSPAKDRPFERTSWPTPRVSAATASHVITDRTADDLSTLAMFVTRIDGAPQRRTRAGDCMDARWVEDPFPPEA